MKKKLFALIYTVGVIIMGFAVVFLSFAVAIGITDLRIKVSNIPNMMIYFQGISLFSFFLGLIFSLCLILVVVILFKKLRAKSFLFDDIRIPLIIIVVCIIGIYSNFWAISKDNIYFSSITTLGFIEKYDYKDVTNISISVNGGKGGPTMHINLNVKGHKLDLEQGYATEEVRREFIATLRTKYYVPVSVNKHGYTKYDGEIDYLLDN